MRYDIVKKLEYYCAYQERCQQEVRQKLRDFKIFGEDAEEIIAHLISENYLNEARFAALFAGGKFRQKKWGRIKIRQALKQKDISKHCIESAFKTEINEADYLDTLDELIEKKRMEYFNNQTKIVQYLLSRGFEYELILQVFKKS